MKVQTSKGKQERNFSMEKDEWDNPPNPNPEREKIKLIVEQGSDTAFAELMHEVDLAMSGESLSIPIGLKRLGRYANIRKKIMQLVFSSTGAGKSSIADEAYILTPYEFLRSSLNTKGLKMKTILFSMERARRYRIAKWVARSIWMDEGIPIPLPKMLGWWDEKLTLDEHDLISSREDYINSILEDVDIYEGPRSPDDLFRICKGKFEANGKYEKLGPNKNVYIPDDEKVIWNIIIDHGNLSKKNAKYRSKKDAIDGNVEHCQQFRDTEGAHIVWIAQVNRDASNPMRQKSDDMELNLDDVKASGDVGDACDIALSLFDPLKYKQSSKTGYNPQDFVDEEGAKFFRSVTVCKSSYGADDIRCPLAFNGFCGQFKELPAKKTLSDAQIQQIIRDTKSGEYFLNKKNRK